MKKFLSKPHALLVVFVVFNQVELFAVNSVSDLRPGTSNWIVKAQQILDLQIPTDNFYGPGAALLLTPFVLVGLPTYLANHFYFALGAVGYWKICQAIPSRIGRLIALFALPANVYLIWLIDSSQDTVFEFFLLTWSVYFLSRKRIGLFAISGFMLCETRAGYWVFYLGVSALLFLRTMRSNPKRAARKLFAIYFLVGSSIFNIVNYGSPSPALEGGLTAYFGYTKYHYLSLPKMDMDVFLSGPSGAFSPLNGPKIPSGSTSAEINSIYQKAAIESALNNKKETVLGWMQKFDSYFFDVQKIPHLPGEYVLDQEKKIISIGEERLSWNLVMGNLTYMMYRSVLLVTGLVSVGLLIGLAFMQRFYLFSQLRLLPLALPFFFGAIPGILIYTETRFKIVSELLLIPLIMEIWVRAKNPKNTKEVIS
jgi:hypothetical protein